MRFNDSHAAEFRQDSGEVRAVYVLLGLTAASALLPLSWEPRFQLQPLMELPVSNEPCPWHAPALSLPSALCFAVRQLH